jgi:hypothetical protein
MHALYQKERERAREENVEMNPARFEASPDNVAFSMGT